MIVDDLLDLVDDEPFAASNMPPWQVLVVDDDPEVHHATDLALRGSLVEGRSLQLSHAYSAGEARQLLPQSRELAVILLDVVMETERAGLDLVDFIRTVCGLLQTRIILRTGQPGYAPELGVVERYDINDYRTKAELTRSRLLTALQAAIRSYQQIRILADHRRGLELIVRGAHGLLRAPSLKVFADSVLDQLAALAGQPIDALFCAHVDGSAGARVVAACGGFREQQGLNVTELAPGASSTLLRQALARRHHQFEEGLAVLFLDCGSHDAAVLLAASAPLEQQLLEVFAATLTGCYGNLRRFEEVNFVAYHDRLTGLANRVGFVRELDAARPDARHAVALVDLRDFSALNDGLGHDVGNALLLAVARRLRDRFAAHCVLARVGGDVFGLCGPPEQLSAETVLALFADPFACGEHRLPAHVAVGMAVAPAEAGHGIVTLSRAGIALNSAKHARQGQIAHFQPAMEEHVRDRLVLINRLRSALEHNALDVWFQPQVELGSGRVVGIEALARWPMTDAPGGWCSPAVFVPLAESSGLIGAIGEFVLDRACAALAQLAAQDDPPLRMAVNVAMPQLRQPAFAERVHQALQRHGLDPTRLEIEITESVALEDPRMVREGLDALRALGSRVAIDDFGTGYSSLAQVRDMPIDVLKLDRSFVQAVDQPQGAAFAETIVRMAQRLGLHTVAEGVETPEQAACLHALGCDTGQGYLFARPMPFDTLRDWLSQRATSAR